MSNEDKMTINEQRKYLRIQQKRYKKADKREKTKLLNEIEETTGKHRKGLIGLMNGDLERKHRKKQRGQTYGIEVDDGLRKIAEFMIISAQSG